MSDKPRESFRCSVFGHARPLEGWWGDGLYGRIRGGAVDGCGRTHFEVMLKCPRCNNEYMAARFHGTDPALLKPQG